MKDLKWPAVVVVGILVVTLGVLSYFDKDASMVLTSVVTVLTALGFGYTLNKQSELQNSQTKIQESTDTIKEQTNGNLTAFMKMLEEQHSAHRRDMREMANTLAGMSPPAAVAAPEDGTYAQREHSHPSNL